MSQPLSKQHLTSLLALAQSREKARSADTAPSVDKIVFGKRPPLATDQSELLTRQSESFARRASDSLSSRLRVKCEITFASIDQTSGTKFLEALPAPAYLASFATNSPSPPVFVHIDLPLALPMTDLLLGGPGTDSVDPRDLTEIEENVFASVPRVMAAELKNAWPATAEMDIRFAQREALGELKSQPSLAEEFVCLRFTLSLLQKSGTLAFLLPERFVEALLRKPPSQSLPLDANPSSVCVSRIRELMLNARFEVCLSLPKTPLRLSELLALEPGRLVVLNSPIQNPAELSIGSRSVFRAFPVRHGSRKGARIVSRAQAANSIPTKQETK